MRIEKFELESWLNPLDPLCKYNLGASCVKAFGLKEMLDFVGEDSNQIMEELANKSLHYGEFDGSKRLKKAVAGIYKNADPEMVITTHGGTGANNMILTELLNPADNIIVITPTYQQHYSIPANLGVEVRKVRGTADNNWLPAIDEIRERFDENTRMIIATSPSNPAGIYIKPDLMNEIVELAMTTGAYVLFDEMYRGLDDEYMPSIIDVYEKGISTSSMSKVYSMAGTRVGWIVVRDPELYDRIFNRRSFDTICGGVIDEFLAAIALEHSDKILERSRKIVRANKEMLDKWMEDHPRLHYCGESYGSTAMISYDYDISATEFGQRLFDEEKVLICHGDVFEEEKTFRLGYGFGETDLLSGGLDALGKFLKRLEDEGK
ncbi:MAG: aminotransferase class I/II-fold pyridoxal phosphate-dependent enzyme [Hornefia butyriciproducens]|uniref:aminotransferase class I/II-fold pyridoxal phosphate-dependent enzyme n=1 Tax=Hornefia butyriciproducens TaxID=2652293 RepID=UPI002A751CF1|nr:aminotransferase class I/II-fold pyridoxal phosphate-dependent enzyme [Hornefia butyriciproducens]MDY2990950.1 aminotransferase class I/II-fold pyridoxal phosphate-dependent enzyme [Hornefia butyriciproducens]